jgi:hypothetical protein
MDYENITEFLHVNMIVYGVLGVFSTEEETDSENNVPTP